MGALGAGAGAFEGDTVRTDQALRNKQLNQQQSQFDAQLAQRQSENRTAQANNSRDFRQNDAIVAAGIDRNTNALKEEVRQADLAYAENTRRYNIDAARAARADSWDDVIKLQDAEKRELEYKQNEEVYSAYKKTHQEALDKEANMKKMFQGRIGAMARVVTEAPNGRATPAEIAQINKELGTNFAGIYTVPETGEIAYDTPDGNGGMKTDIMDPAKQESAYRMLYGDKYADSWAANRSGVVSQAGKKELAGIAQAGKKELATAAQADKKELAAIAQAGRKELAGMKKTSGSADEATMKSNLKLFTDAEKALRGPDGEETADSKVMRSRIVDLSRQIAGVGPKTDIDLVDTASLSPEMQNAYDWVLNYTGDKNSVQYKKVYGYLPKVEGYSGSADPKKKDSSVTSASGKGWKFPTKHPNVRNKDGSHSNVILASTTMTDANGEERTYVYPTMVDGKKLSHEDALAIADKNKWKGYPSFKTIAEAEEWAQNNHANISEDGTIR